MVIAFNKLEGIECLQVIDERSAAFFALGMAQRALDRRTDLHKWQRGAQLRTRDRRSVLSAYPLLVMQPIAPKNGWIKAKGQTIRQQGVLALHMKRSVQLYA